MRAGLPIVATDVGGNPEAIRNGKDGFLVPVGEVEMFAKTILFLESSPEIRKQVGASARKRFEENFTEEIMVKHTAQWFLKALKQAAA
jgi:glycosyltransferase involved in cell wall biosynthesis